MIKAMFNTGEIRAKMAAKLEAVERKFLAILQTRGEEFVAACRDDRTYKDETGNLRSSIGYFIYKGNTEIESNTMQKAGPKGSGADGLASVKPAVEEIAKQQGVYYLIGVAGMNYAAAVEAKGFNVISNQTIMIIDLLRGDFNSLQSKL